MRRSRGATLEILETGSLCQRAVANDLLCAALYFGFYSVLADFGVVVGADVGFAGAGAGGGAGATGRDYHCGLCHSQTGPVWARFANVQGGAGSRAQVAGQHLSAFAATQPGLF